MDVEQLNELRSIEELSNFQKGVKSEITGLEEEFAGLPYPEAAREKYADLRETNEEIDRRVTELDKRQKYLEAMSRAPAHVAPAWTEPRREERVTTTERDIYDTSSVRVDLDNPDKG